MDFFVVAALIQPNLHLFASVVGRETITNRGLGIFLSTYALPI
jgi:hypothetical protein